MVENITVVGNVVGEPRFAVTTGGVEVLTLRVAADSRHFDRAADKWVDGETNWYNVKAFRGLAVNAHASLTPGMRIIVRGRLKIRQWTNGERKGIAVDLEADALGADLRWGTTAFARANAHDADVIPLGAPTQEWATAEEPVEAAADQEAVPF